VNRRLVLVGGAVLGLIAVIWLAPVALAQVPFFRVRQVELIGVRYLSPETVLEALALEPDQNVFDDLDEVEQRVAGLAGVTAVRATRKVPGTIRVEIAERLPAALASGRNGMVVLDCDAHPLPYDPAASGLDLPVVERADTTLLAMLCAVREADSSLYQDIDGVRHAGNGTAVLDVGSRRVLLGGGPTNDDIRAVGAVVRHLAETGRPHDEIDARFQGWVVVRRSRT
jgi:cell division protein FtsQ